MPHRARQIIGQQLRFRFKSTQFTLVSPHNQTFLHAFRESNSPCVHFKAVIHRKRAPAIDARHYYARFES